MNNLNKRSVTITDAKTAYSSCAESRKLESLHDQNLTDIIQRALIRKSLYQNNWKKVDINNVVNKFTPGAIPTINLGKIEFVSLDGKYNVVTDIAGGYLRIFDLTTNQYVGLNGENLHNYTDSRGKQHGRSKANFQEVTHFKIKKRGEQ